MIDPGHFKSLSLKACGLLALDRFQECVEACGVAQSKAPTEADRRAVAKVVTLCRSRDRTAIAKEKAALGGFLTKGNSVAPKSAQSSGVANGEQNSAGPAEVNAHCAC